MLFSIATVIENLTNWKREKQREAIHDWAAFVAAVLDGEVVDPGEQAAYLAKMNRSESDLRAALEELEQRRQRQAAAQEAGPLRVRVENIRQQMQRASDALERARKKYDAAIRPLRDELLEAEGHLRMAENAEQQLTHTLPAAARDKLKPREDQIALLSRERMTLQGELSKNFHLKPVSHPNGSVRHEPNLASREASAKSELAELQRMNRKLLNDTQQQRLKALPAEIKALAKEREQAEKRLAEANAELDKLQRQYRDERKAVALA